MKKELHPGIIAAIIVVVVALVGAWAWKAVGPPAPAGIKSFDKAELQVMKQKHAESAREIQQEQQRLLQLGKGDGR